MRIAYISTLLYLTACLGTAVAADERSKLSNFNPFSKQDQNTSPASTTRISDDRGSQPRGRFRFSSLPSVAALPRPKLPSMPKLRMPKWGRTSTANRRRSPSVWNQLNTNTKTLFAKTKATLMPWTANQTNARSNSNAAHIARRSERRPGSSTNFFANLFNSKPEPKEIRSVNDFLAQPRPQPER